MTERWTLRAREIPLSLYLNSKFLYQRRRGAIKRSVDNCAKVVAQRILHLWHSLRSSFMKKHIITYILVGWMRLLHAKWHHELGKRQKQMKIIIAHSLKGFIDEKIYFLLCKNYFHAKAKVVVWKPWEREMNGKCAKRVVIAPVVSFHVILGSPIHHCMSIKTVLNPLGLKLFTSSFSI